MSGSHALFVYGTLLDAEVRRRVLSRGDRGDRGDRGEAPSIPAVLHGFELRQADGFYFVRSVEGERVSGQLLRLDDDELERADAWEDVPVYQRIRARVVTDDGEEVDAWVYVREGVDGERVRNRGIAAHDRETVLRMLDVAKES